MARSYFRRAAAGTVTVSGIVISRLQDALNATVPPKIVADGIFGSQTRDLIAHYQSLAALPVTGEMDDATWPALMHVAEPSMFERALQLTAHFEGTGFTVAVGNFDGAGLTWGIIGFTLSNGELGDLLVAISKAHPALFNQAFGADAAVILDKVALPPAQRVAWGDSISRGAKKYAVAEPWRTYLADLGAFPEVQAMQLSRAHDKYWAIAVRDATVFGLTAETDYALFYDIAVQNGGCKSKGRTEKIKARYAASPDKSVEHYRRIVVEVLVETSTWKADVRSRKTAIINGGGIVHGGSYHLPDWGILPGVIPQDIG